jgi:endo-1,4-beta-xylanase
MKSTLFLAAILCNSIFSACQSIQVKGLKTAYKSDFLIGAALNNRQFEEQDANVTNLITREFNSITPENVMKSQEIHPEWNRYNFGPADALVAFGQKHNMVTIGHTLVWHSQLSRFAQNIKSADSLNRFLEDHISTVAGRYAGKIKGWDVVNEALNEDGTLRKSVFFNVLGEDYIIKAFQLAANAAPNTELYYNDYNNEAPQKRAGCIAIIKKLQAAGARIDGVGIQGHWHAKKVPYKDIEESIIAYAALGLKVHFTELDLTVIPNPWDTNTADVAAGGAKATTTDMNPYTTGLPTAIEAEQAQAYEQLFKIFLKHKDKIGRVTLWGVNDGSSWLNNWPIRGRTNYPLLFDRAYAPKQAYNSILGLKK